MVAAEAKICGRRKPITQKSSKPMPRKGGVPHLSKILKTQSHTPLEARVHPQTVIVLVIARGQKGTRAVITIALIKVVLMLPILSNLQK